MTGCSDKCIKSQLFNNFRCLKHNLKTWAWEASPLMIDGVLYLTTSLSQAVALDAATGKLLWVYDPETWKNGVPANNGFVHRGVSYWADGDDTRIVYGTGDGYLICIHAKTGKPVESFGDKGRIDLTQGLGRPVERKLYGVSMLSGKQFIVVATGGANLPAELIAFTL
jgi:quinoprotein glucose dehydrogenase